MVPLSLQTVVNQVIAQMARGTTPVSLPMLIQGATTEEYWRVFLYLGLSFRRQQKEMKPLVPNCHFSKVHLMVMPKSISFILLYTFLRILWEIISLWTMSRLY